MRTSSPARVQIEKNLNISIRRGEALKHKLGNLPTLGGAINHSSIYLGNDQVIGVTKSKVPVSGTV